MRKYIVDCLEKTGKQFKVKFDILNERLLTEIAKEGSRLVHLTSNIFEKDKLWIEGSHGIANEKPTKNLNKLF